MNEFSYSTDVSVDITQPEVNVVDYCQEETQSAVDSLNNVYVKSEPVCETVKEERVDNEISVVKLTHSSRPRTLLKPTIILATTKPNPPMRQITVNVKTEPQTDSFETSAFTMHTCKTAFELNA